MHRCYYEVDCGYPVSMHEKIDPALIERLGESESSGFGFGIRDNQWQFRTREAANSAVKAIREVFAKHELREDDEAPRAFYVGTTHTHWDDVWGDLASVTDSMMYPEEDCLEEKE
jgi:hypothetical protein